MPFACGAAVSRGYRRMPLPVVLQSRCPRCVSLLKHLLKVQGVTPWTSWRRSERRARRAACAAWQACTTTTIRGDSGHSSGWQPVSAAWTISASQLGAAGRCGHGAAGRRTARQHTQRMCSTGAAQAKSAAQHTRMPTPQHTRSTRACPHHSTRAAHAQHTRSTRAAHANTHTSG